MKANEIALLAMKEAQTHSFEKVSMQLLADKIGVKKASFYYHFPSKDALAVAAIGQAKSILEKYFKRYQNQSATVQIQAYIALFAVHMQPIKNLCPGAGFVAAWPHQKPPVQAAVQGLYECHQGYLGEIIQQGIEQGEFASDLPAATLAQTLFCMLQGGLLAARVTGSDDVFTGLNQSITTLLRG